MIDHLMKNKQGPLLPVDGPVRIWAHSRSWGPPVPLLCARYRPSCPSRSSRPSRASLVSRARRGRADDEGRGVQRLSDVVPLLADPDGERRVGRADKDVCRGAEELVHDGLLTLGQPGAGGEDRWQRGKPHKGQVALEELPELDVILARIGCNVDSLDAVRSCQRLQLADRRADGGDGVRVRVAEVVASHVDRGVRSGQARTIRTGNGAQPSREDKALADAPEVRHAVVLVHQPLQAPHQQRGAGLANELVDEGRDVAEDIEAREARRLHDVTVAKEVAAPHAAALLEVCSGVVLRQAVCGHGRRAVAQREVVLQVEDVVHDRRLRLERQELAQLNHRRLTAQEIDVEESGPRLVLLVMPVRVRERREHQGPVLPCAGIEQLHKMRRAHVDVSSGVEALAAIHCVQQVAHRLWQLVLRLASRRGWVGEVGMSKGQDTG
eukprot:m.252856 g.252856  ORF g.252856 m.252856 type:complete len:438 (+) comp17997_c0_seq1:112-1425(+)